MNFDAQVDLWVHASVANGVTIWRDLLTSLPGVYPNQVLESLKRQGLCERVSFSRPWGETSAARQSTSIAHRLWSSGDLPTPHLLDACWWFADCSILSLLNHVHDNCRSSGHVILLGIPTFFHYARKQALLERVTLIDADPDVAVAATDPRHDVCRVNLLRDELPRMSGEIVIADPPWYESEIRAFLWAARHLCSKGGLILTSVPPVGTRPGIGEEWSRTLTWSRGLGMELVNYHKGVLRYISPLFERNALAAAGIRDGVENWRCGDLAMFSCTGPIAQPRPVLHEPDAWEQYSVEGVRFRVRAPAPIPGFDPMLYRVAAGDIFDSVSRRDSRRHLVDVWTSGNRAFRCSARTIFIQILRILASNNNIDRQICSAWSGHTLERVRAAVTRIQNIVRTEVDECSAMRATDDFLDNLSIQRG
jgi:Probable N6-adenine methyltransferase